MSTPVSDLKFQNLTISDEKLLFSYAKLTVEQEALSHQWKNLVLQIEKNEDFVLQKLNDTLRFQTYVIPDFLSDADVILFKAIFPVLESNEKLSSGNEEFIAAHRHVLRWIDLLQTAVFKFTDSEKLELNLDLAVPVEVYVKPKKPSAEKDAKPSAEKNAKPTDASAEAKKPKGKPSPEELAMLKEEKAKAKAAKKAANKDNTPSAATEFVPSPGMIDLRVGFIEKAIKHPNADSLYVSTMNVGEAEPRTICSGLVKYYKLEEMQQRHVVVFSNLKKVKMRGIDSLGMVLCASTEEGGVQFIEPPQGSKPGDRVFVEGFGDIQPEKQLNPKKKVWETIQPSFTTDENCNVIYNEKQTDGSNKVLKLVNAKGESFRSASLVGAHIS